MLFEIISKYRPKHINSNMFLKFLHLLLASKRVSKILFFYIKEMVIWEIFLRQNLIKIYNESHEIEPFKKKLLRGMHAPKPP